MTPILGQGTLNVTDATSDDLVSITQGGPNLCTSDDIAKMDVSGCTCRSTFPSLPTNLVCVTPSGQCLINCSPQPPASPNTSIRALSMLLRLCRCQFRVQQLLRLVLDSMSVHPRLPSQYPENLHHEPLNWRWPAPTQPIRFVGSSRRWNLITTTGLIADILQLNSVADVDGAFRLGQDTLNNRGIRDTGTTDL